MAKPIVALAPSSFFTSPIHSAWKNWNADFARATDFVIFRFDYCTVLAVDILKLKLVLRLIVTMLKCVLLKNIQLI